VIAHECRESKSCCCSSWALESNEDCPVHSGGPWPPRCEVCGKFLPWSVRGKPLNVDAFGIPI
jgi:hypothetical protein